MSETILIWLFGILGAWLAALTMAFDKMRISNTKNQVAIDLFIDTLGEKIARALHADDDHLGIDGLLDKYLNRHYELSFEEWARLKEAMLSVSDRKTATEMERLLASFMAAVATHKITAKYGKVSDVPDK